MEAPLHLFAIFALESAAIIIGNTFTIVVFWNHKLRLKRTCFLLINLALADLIVGITEAVVLVTNKIPNFEEKQTTRIQHPSVVFYTFGSSTSVLFFGSYFAGTRLRRFMATASSSNKPKSLHPQHHFYLGGRLLYGWTVVISRI